MFWSFFFSLKSKQELINNFAIELNNYLYLIDYELDIKLKINSIMGLFGTSDKKIIAELCKKSEDISKDITNEIDELLNELKSDYYENNKVVNEFNDFAKELQSKLSPEDASKLLEFTSRLSKVKRCAKKGVEAMRELSRDQRKATRETLREYQEYLYV